MDDSLIEFNGIDARTGGYLLELTTSQIARLAAGETLEEATRNELLARKNQADTRHYGAIEGVDVSDLAQAGWGVLFAACAPDGEQGQRQAAILEALTPLLELRRTQATRVSELRYRVYTGAEGVRPADSKATWLARRGTSSGPADPDKVPYYLLLVGSPEEISYRVQSQLAVQRAVGRLHFDTVDEYAAYARSVVAAETGKVVLPRRATFFGVANPDDKATQASAKSLVGALADSLAGADRFCDWDLRRLIGPQATRSALDGLLRGDDRSALLFTATHGMGFPNGDPLQFRHQGALLCQDWPGPAAWGGKPIPEEFYVAGEHLSADANLLGTVAFLFACFGAGTPAIDEFSKRANTTPKPLAPRPFVANLPQAMLSRPKGGALAVIGHVERAWSHSFLAAGTGPGGRQGAQITAFESTSRALLGGLPVGAAMDYFEQRYAELASDLTAAIEVRDYLPEGTPDPDPYGLADLWTAHNDARGYTILGDPAVRLATGFADPDAPRPTVPEILGVPATPAPAPSAAAPALTEPAPTEPAATTADGSVSYGLFGWGKDQPAGPAEPGSIQRFLNRLGDGLSRALDDATSLEVSTWVAADMANARWEGGKIVGGELRAFTRVSLDGDTVVCLPQKDGEVDKEVWEIHSAAVEQAQRTRAELMKTLVEAAASLASLTK